MASVFDTGEQGYVQEEQVGEEESTSSQLAQLPAPGDTAEAKQAAQDTGMIKMQDSGQDLDRYLSGYEGAVRSGNPQNSRRASASSVLNADLYDVQAQTRDWIRENATSEQDMLDAITASQDLTRRIRERQSSPTVEQREAMRGVASGGVSSEELDMAGVDRKIQEDLASREEEVSWGDYAWSLGRELITLGTATGFDMAGLVGTKNILDTQEALQGQALAFQAETDPARKAALWEDLKRRADEELPEADALSFLKNMASASGATGFREYGDSALMWSAFDGVTAAGSLATAPLKSIAKSAKHMGNKKLAGRANARVLEDVEGQVAEKMGMKSKREAADNAHPVQPPDRTANDPEQGVVSESSMSLETQTELQAHRDRLNQGVDNLITGKSRYLEKGIHPEEAARVDEILQRKTARYVESIRADVQHSYVSKNPDGSVTVTSAVVPKGFSGIPDSKELERAGRKLAELEADGFLTRQQSQFFADTAKAKGSSIESIDEGIALLQEGVGVDEAVKFLDHQAAQTITKTFRATLDETTGTYTQDRLPLGAWARSNRSAATTPDTVRDFEAAARLDNTSASVARELTNEYNSIIKELPITGGSGVPVGRRKAKMRIQQALIDGDEWVDPKTGEEIGKVWTPDELTNKFGLSDKEKTAYYKLRNLYDALWRIRNDAVRKELQSRGFYDIRAKRPFNYVDDEGNNQQIILNQVGRPTETAGAANTALNRARVGQVFDTSLGELVDVPTDLSQRYASGQRLVEFYEPVNLPGVGRIRYALADSLDEIRDLPSQVLSYKTAYVPRVYDKGVWFVKQTAPFARVDGNLVETPEVLRTIGMSDNEATARALQKQLADDAARMGEVGQQFQVFEAEQVDPLDMALSGATGSGGKLYTSSRGSRPVPFYKLEGNRLLEEKASRVDAFEALQSNINNIAFHYPRTEWRIAATHRIQNTAEKLGVQWNGIHQEATGGTTQARAFIERKRSELRDWLAIPDSWESRWNDTLQTLYEKTLGVKVKDVSIDDMLGKIPSRGVWWLKSHDPVTALRAATFHLLLGWGNPSQMFVQAQGFSVALSQIGLNQGAAGITRTWRRQSILRSLENAVDNDTAEGMAKVLANKGIIESEDVDYMLELHKVWRKSGLGDSLLTTGDFKNAGNAMGQGYGALAEFANNKGLWFYRQGELFNRRFSLTAAFDDYVKKNPSVLKKGLTDAEGQQIVSRANDYMLNLGKANKAAWQKGVLSIPTQFWQVQAKLLEEMFTFSAGKVLNRKEKLALMLGQIGLYGAAGVPLLGSVGSFYADQATDPDGVANRGFDEGLYGIMFSLLGAEVDVAQRGAILADVQGLLYDYLGGDKGIVELFLGAGNTTLGRTGEALQRMQPLAIAAHQQEIPQTAEDYLMVVDAIGDMTSTWSNASKAVLMWKDDIIWSRSGKKLVEDKFNLQTLMFTAAGFSPTKQTQTYSLGTMSRMLEGYRRDVKKSVKKYMLDLIQAHQLSGRPISEKDAAKFRATAGYLTAGLLPNESQELVAEVQEEVMTGKTEFARATQEYMRTSSQMIVDDVLSLFEKSVVGSSAIEEESIE